MQRPFGFVPLGDQSAEFVGRAEELERLAGWFAYSSDPMLVVGRGGIGKSSLMDCKRYAKHRPVEVSVVRQLLGVVEVEKASAGVIATTSRFTKGALELRQQYPFRLGLQDYFDVQKLLRDAASWRAG